MIDYERDREFKQFLKHLKSLYEYSADPVQDYICNGVKEIYCKAYAFNAMNVKPDMEEMKNDL